MEAGTEISHVPLCSKNFMVIAIGGFKSTTQEVEDAGWRFYAFLHDLSNRHKKEHLQNVKIIENSSNSLTSVPPIDVQKLHDCLSTMSRCKNGITCVIFAHSHAAKVVREALADEAMMTLKWLGPAENKQEKIKSIRENLAIFTYGGIDDVPRNLAKIALNLRLKKDVKAAIGRSWFGDAHEKEALEVTFDERKPPKVSDPTPLKLKSYPKLLGSLFTSQTKHLPHEYLDNAQFMQYISDVLMLNAEQKCSCTCSSIASPCTYTVAEVEAPDGT